jgi:hypothetical protein
MSTVQNGKVCINTSGVNGPYFKTHRGLRQGDQLSSLLFNLVGDGRVPKYSGYPTGGKIRHPARLLKKPIVGDPKSTDSMSAA